MDVDALRAHLTAALLQKPDGSGRVLLDFEFWGEAVDIEAHTTARAAEGEALLDAISALEDP